MVWNTGSGEWGKTNNWYPPGVPGANDTAIIVTPGVIVSLNVSTTIGGIILGTNGVGPVTLMLAGQTLTLNGPLTVNPGGVFTVDGGGLQGNINAVLSGTIGWSGGNLGGVLTLATGSTLNITLGGKHDMPDCTFTNHGTVVWNGGPVRVGGSYYGSPGTAIYNDGRWEVQGDLAMNNDFIWAGTTLYNLGVYRKSAGTGSGGAVVGEGVAFNQLGGELDVRQGNLRLQGGGHFMGGTATNNSGCLYLSSGSFTLNGTVTGTNVIENAGNLSGVNVIQGALQWQAGSWGGATVTVSTAAVLYINTPANHDLADGVYTNHGTVIWTDGSVRGGGSYYASPGTIICNDGLWEVQGDLAMKNYFIWAPATFNNLGVFCKSAGTGSNGAVIGTGVLFNQLDGEVDMRQGSLMLQGGGHFTGGRATNNLGAVYLSSGSFTLNGTVTGTNVIENAGNLSGLNVIHGGLQWQAGSWGGATVTVSGESLLFINGPANHDFADGVHTNHGTVIWTGGLLRGGGSYYASPGTAIYNDGVWEVQGDLTMNDFFGWAGTTFNNLGWFCKTAGTGSSGAVIGSGVLFNQQGGGLDVRQGNLRLQGGGHFLGGTATNTLGCLYLSSGSFTLNGTLTGTNVIQEAGNLSGVNVIQGALQWQAGSWVGANVTVSTGAVLYVNTPANHDLADGVHTNYGTVIWTEGLVRGGGSYYGSSGTTIYNDGRWEMQGDLTMNNDFGWGGTRFNNLGVFCKSAGTGNAMLTSGLTFANAGQLDVQCGNLTIQGGYTPVNGSGLSFRLGGVEGNGSISLSGAASFVGRLSVNLNGSYWPAPGSTFTLLTYPASAGPYFSEMTLPAPGYLSWQTNCTTTAFTLTAMAQIATNTVATNVCLSTLDGTNLLLQWPGDHTGCALQVQHNPIHVGLSTHWETVPNSCATNQMIIPLDKTEAAVFYRLVGP